MILREIGGIYQCMKKSTVLRTRVDLGPDFGGIWGPFFASISTIFGSPFSNTRKSRSQWGFRIRIRTKKLLKNASTNETLKTRSRPRFACQKMDCSRGKGLENASKMPPKMPQKCLNFPGPYSPLPYRGCEGSHCLVGYHKKLDFSRTLQAQPSWLQKLLDDDRISRGLILSFLLYLLFVCVIHFLVHLLLFLQH